MSPGRALIVGGTGPTGPYVVSALCARGYEVTVFHRGTHEAPEIQHVEHLHGDPHFDETIRSTLGDREFDLVVALYGRVRLLAPALAGRCERFISVGGIPVYRGFAAPRALFPTGLPLGTSEDGAAVMASPSSKSIESLSHAMFRAEETVLGLHQDGAFSATIMRYPSIYGPRQPNPREWSVVRRVLDGRGFMLLPDGGLSIMSRCAAANAAHSILLAIDNPGAAAGRVFNCGDDRQFTLAQWVQLVSRAAGRELEIVAIPHALAWSAHGLLPNGRDSDHALVSNSAIRDELGYADAIDPEKAVAELTAWYVSNPPTDLSGDARRDDFDYELEDEMLSRYRRLVATLEKRRTGSRERAHSYPHPKAPDLSRDHRGR